jgi:choice-of-anchor C domain-containing protein
MKKLVLLTVLILALSASMAMAAPAFQNGSFELGKYVAGPGGQYETFTTSVTDITGWTTGGTIDWINTYWVADDLDFSLDLNGLNGAGSISQTFATVSGTKYNVVFAMSGNPDGGPAMKAMIQAGAGIDTYNFSIAGVTHGNMLWTDKSFSFIASGDEATLTFASLNDPFGSYGPALDNVRVTAVPEASTFIGFGSALLMAGPGMIGWLRRRRS